MSAAELRKAAETLRERVQNATPSPWRHTDSEVVDDVFDAGLVVVGPDRDPIALVADNWYEDQEGEPTPWHDATYIATMHPDVGLALADWLDATANEHDSSTGNSNVDAFFSAFDTASDLAALALARLINGSAS